MRESSEVQSGLEDEDIKKSQKIENARFKRRGNIIEIHSDGGKVVDVYPISNEEFFEK